MLLKQVFNAGAEVLDKLERETVSLSNLFEYNSFCLFS